MKKILFVLLLLVVLLGGSAPAYADKSGPRYDYFQRYSECTITDHVDDTYWVRVILAKNSVPFTIDQDLIWQDIGGELFPAFPAVGSAWKCWVEGYIESDEMPGSFEIFLTRIILITEVNP